MADVAEVKKWKYLDDYEEGKDDRKLKPVPAHTMVFEITGPMFFAAAEKILDIIKTIHNGAFDHLDSACTGNGAGAVLHL